jgi:hypothetical protein
MKQKALQSYNFQYKYFSKQWVVIKRQCIKYRIWIFM